MFEYTYDLASGKLIESFSDRATESETQGGTSPDIRRLVRVTARYRWSRRPGRRWT